MKKYSRSQPHVRGLLDPAEVSCSKGWHIGELLVVYWWMTWSCSDSPWCKVKQVPARLHDGMPGHLDVKKTLDKVRQRYCWLQARHNFEEWCQHCNTYAASPGPRTRGLGPVQEESNQYSRTLPSKWPREPIPPDHYGQFYQVTRSLNHSQPKGVDSGRSTGYQLLLLQSTRRATQWPGL
jgi:hypothetical protein